MAYSWDNRVDFVIRYMYGRDFIGRIGLVLQKPDSENGNAKKNQGHLDGHPHTSALSSTSTDDDEEKDFIQQILNIDVRDTNYIEGMQLTRVPYKGVCSPPNMRPFAVRRVENGDGCEEVDEVHQSELDSNMNNI